MKIFNWVHRKFSNNKENSDNNKTNGGTISVIGDHDHQLWSGGILTIGTFGYDPILKDFHEENDRFLHEEVVEYDQMNITSDDDFEEDKEEEEEEADENNEEEEEAFVFEAYEHESEEGILMEGNNYKREFEYVMMEKKERITLADLFSEDHDEEKLKKKPINNHNNNNASMKKGGIMSKEKANCKHGFSSFAKKLIAEEARPIHKLNQMVRRMMRRKIHPDLLSPLNSKAPVKMREVNNDNASLLPTQDAIV